VETHKGIVLQSATNVHVDLWATGLRFTREHRDGMTEIGVIPNPPEKGTLLDQEKEFYSAERPQYENEDIENFVSVLSKGAKNDGSELDNNADMINEVLREAADNNKIVVFPAGVYAVSKTIEVPPNSRIVGIMFPQIAAYGREFQDHEKPTPVLQVGNSSTTQQNGLVHISDLVITNRGATAGALYIQWNIHEKSKGSAAMWNVIVRVGGAAGTELSSATCHQFGKQPVKSFVSAAFDAT
jgi:hypothetical protein